MAAILLAGLDVITDALLHLEEVGQDHRSEHHGIPRQYLIAQLQKVRVDLFPRKDIGLDLFFLAGTFVNILDTDSYLVRGCNRGGQAAMGRLSR